MNLTGLHKCLEQSTQAHENLRLVVIAIGINDREAGASVGTTTLLHEIKCWGIQKGIEIKFVLIPFSHDLSHDYKDNLIRLNSYIKETFHDKATDTLATSQVNIRGNRPRNIHHDLPTARKVFDLLLAHI